MMEFRYEVALAIATINKVSKEVCYAIEVDRKAEVKTAIESDSSYRSMAEDIIKFLKNEQDSILYEQLICLPNSKPILKYATGLKSDTMLILHLSDLATAIDMLQKYAYELRRENSPYPDLEPFLANDETAELLKRAVNAGILTEDYQPKKNIKMYQLKLIALAIIEIQGFKTRDRWCHFDEQWKLGTAVLARTKIPLSKGNDLYRITKLYPEVDFYKLLSATEKIELFNTHFSENGAVELCKALKKHDFLDKKTNEDTFLAIMGLRSIPPHQVNWVGSFDSLVYFCREAFSDLTPNMLQLTARWFTLDGNDINHGTLKTKSSRVARMPEKYGFIPLLSTLISKAVTKR